MKLVVDRITRTAIFAAQRSESIEKLHASWVSYKLFTGAEELALLRDACAAVRREYGGVCYLQQDTPQEGGV